jgi:hypothetical protein
LYSAATVVLADAVAAARAPIAVCQPSERHGEMLHPADLPAVGVAWDAQDCRRRCVGCTSLWVVWLTVYMYLLLYHIAASAAKMFWYVFSCVISTTISWQLQRGRYSCIVSQVAMVAVSVFLS